MNFDPGVLLGRQNSEGCKKNYNDFSYTVWPSAMKFDRISGPANRQLFPEFGELWAGVPRYHAATCISHSLMHLLLLTFTFMSKRAL